MKTLFSPILVVALFVGACSNPVEPMSETTSEPSHTPIAKLDKTMPMMEVSYVIWSEKGVPAEVDVSMWLGEGFQKERIHLGDLPMQYKFYVHPAQYRDLDFVFYSRSPQALVRGQIIVDGQGVAYGTTHGGVIPLVSLDARGYGEASL